ncbi:MAG: type I DNA topoisomerase [Armatimonadetes bacterium]|nr:type I DNA topoisomerase [Armatimonadota bacterium]
MPKHAIIVESPGKTRTLSRFVGDDYKILASMGHVRDLPQKDLGVDVEHGFAPVYEVTAGAKKVLSKLKQELKDVDTVYLASDPDREGEAIGWHLAEALKLKNPRRIRFNEITQEAVQEALAHPTEIDAHLVDAQQARRVLDRLVGYLISPVLWKRIRTGKDRSLSAGRVQSAALRMIVDREREIGAFVAEEYWSLEATLTPTDREAPFVAELRTRDGEKLELRSQEEADAARAELEGAAYRVAEISRQRRRQNPHPPFITSTLQQQASSRLRFPASKTMRVAQQLYEGVELPDGTTALITYMRTDSTRIADSARREAVDYIRAQFGEKHVGPGAQSRGKKGAQNVQDAHEAVRPTHVEHTPEAMKAHLSPDQYRLYELIWQRFVASQMAAAEFDVTTADVEAGRHGLRATGSVPVFAGFRAVYEEARLNGEEEAEKESRELPELREGEPLNLLGLAPEQHFTKPPPRYTEASLVRALEESGIGRPSTYAQIIDTLRQRSYVEMAKRAFVPTRLGISVCDYLIAYFPQVIDIQFTARVEEDLDTVEQGEQDWVDLVAQFHSPLMEWIREAETAEPRRLGEQCPKCGGELQERFSASGRFAGCENYPQCDYTRDIDLGVPMPELPDVSGETCPECGSALTVKQGPRGAFIGCSGYPDCRYTRPVEGEGEGRPRPVATEIPCEQCGKPMTIRHGRRGPFVGCSGYPDCRATRNLTAEEAAQYGIEGARIEEGGEGTQADAPPDAKCPECGAAMVVRRSRRGPFLGCSRYPKCKGLARMDGAASGASERPAAEAAGESCPDCGKPLMIRAGRRGKFVGCSGYPKCRFTRDYHE